MMTQTIRTLAFGLAAVVTLSACTSLRVTSDVNTALAGSVHCRTYAWAGSFKESSPLRNTIANPVNEARLRSAIAGRLGAAGIQPVDTNADCLVGYGIGSQNIVEGAYPVGVAWGGGFGWHHGWGGGWVGGPAWDYPYVYREGIVTIDIYDGHSKQPLWHASVNQDLTGATGPAAERKIDAAVAALFSKYPAT